MQVLVTLKVETTDGDDAGSAELRCDVTEVPEAIRDASDQVLGSLARSGLNLLRSGKTA